MTQTTVAFALAIRPQYFSLSDKAKKIYLSWSGRSRGKYHVHLDSVWKEFDTEGDAWAFSHANFPDLLGTLRHSPLLMHRAYALRAELFMSLGESRVNDMTEDLHSKVFDLYQAAMHALDATKMSKAIPKVTRVSNAKALSWLEVRTKVRVPYEMEAMLLSVRVLPSPVEENAWSLRLRMPALSDDCLLETQRRFNELVTNLGYQGITVKDVQNGTVFDL